MIALCRPGRLGLGLATALLVAAATFASARLAAAQSASVMAMTGNRPPAAIASAAVGAPDPHRLLNVTVVLALRHRRALDRLLADLHDRASPQYHRWLTPKQFAARFGPAPADISVIAHWLRGRGLDVTAIGYRTIRVTATVTALERAFDTTIKSFGDGTIYANVTAPMIPARFAGLIAAVRGLDNMLRVAPAAIYPRTSRAPTPALPSVNALSSLITPDSGAANPTPGAIVDGLRAAFAPQDFYTFYDEAPEIRSLAGTDCIAVVANSDVLAAALSLFSEQFNLPDVQPTKVLADGSSPGTSSGELEPLLDLEWAHAGAPNAPLYLYLDNPATGSLTDAISAAVNDNLCSTIDISYTFCGEPANFYRTVIDPTLAQGAAQGQSIFIPSGDWGAAGAVLDLRTGHCAPGSSRNVSELSADPNVTSVGGSAFSPDYDSYGNDVGFASESTYNDSGQLVPGATGGGESAIFSKPSYQSGPGVPSDGMRDIPDVAMLASPYLPGVYFSNDNGGTAEISCCAGGTSLGGPIWAAIGWLVDQRAGERQGNINFALYRLAAANEAAAGLRDVLSGNNDYNGVTGYQAGPGYDQTTGWGTVDITQFLAALAPTPKLTPTATASPTATPTSSPTPSSPTATPTPAPTTSPGPTPTSAQSPSPSPSSTLTPRTTAGPTPSPTPIPTLQPTDTATATSGPPAPTPVATPTPGDALLSVNPMDVQASPGSVATVGRFQLHTATAVQSQIGSVTITASDPALFASLTLSASIAGAQGSTSVEVAAPAATSIPFAFPKPLIVPAGATVEFVLKARIAKAPPGS